MVVVVGAGGGVLAATGSGEPSYRTVVVTHRTVEATVNSIGTVTPVSQASVSFPVGGRVAQVPVTVGQHVTTGDVLAALDASSLTASLDNARATLASAQARLAADQTSQTSVTTTTTTTVRSAGSTAQGASYVTSASGRPSATASAAPDRGTDGTAATGGTAADVVKRDQQQLLTDQRAADTVLYQTQADLTHEQAVCGSFLNSLSRSPGDITGSPAPTSSPGAGPATGPTPDGTDCSTLLKQVLAEQDTLSNDLRAVAADEAALDTAVAQLLAQSQGKQPDAGSGQPSSDAGSGQQPSNGPEPTSTAGTSPGTGTGTGGTGSAGAGSGRGTPSSGSGAGGSAAGSSRTASGSTRAPVSAAQIAADQASVDSANATLAVAQQGLDQAQLISPITGVVAAVNVRPGQSVNAGSSTAAIVVLNPGSAEVMTTVSESNVASVKVGAKATVVPDGTDTPTAGTVVAIGLLPTASTASTASGASGASASSSTSGGVSYPVTIGLTNGGVTGGGQLFAGSGAAVSIVVSSATNALAVPSSAVHTIGNRHVVSVLRGGKMTSVPVNVGAVGVTFTQVTSGLSEGDQVVLADLKASLPTSNTTLRGIGGGGGGGAFTGGGRNG